MFKYKFHYIIAEGSLELLEHPYWSHCRRHDFFVVVVATIKEVARGIFAMTFFSVPIGMMTTFSHQKSVVFEIFIDFLNMCDKGKL